MRSPNDCTSVAPRRLHGFSLVELMVAMLIGLIGVILIFQMLAVSEGQKRTTVGIGDAQQNGLLALFSIEREARMAGFGINYVPLFGCTVTAYDATPARDFTFPLLAATITDGAAGAPDEITFVYGNSDLLMGPAKVTLASAAGAVLSKVDNRYGYKAGDLILIGESGNIANGCRLRQVTSLSAVAGSTDQIGHDNVNYVNTAGANVAARYNKAGGLGAAFTAWDNTALTGGRLYSLGAEPAVVTYSLVSGQLMARNLLQSATAIPIAEGIVQLQAEYGKDIDGNGNVSATGVGGDLWEATMPAAPTTTDWSRVIALRVAVVARSAIRDRPNPVTGLCETTTASPTWKAGTAIDVSTDPNWQCYRYRVFETTIPLRNLIWIPE